MVLTAGQTTAFFENADQMGIPNATVVQLAVEGISTLDDLSEFSKDDINNLADSLRRMRVPAIADGPPVEQQRFVMGARSQKRLAVAAQIVRYYEAVGQTLTGLQTCDGRLSPTLKSNGRPFKRRRMGIVLKLRSFRKGLQ